MDTAFDPLASLALGRASAPIRVSIIADFAALEPRRAEWNGLVERSATSTVFQTYEFHASWWKVFGAGKRLLVLLAESGGKLVGIAPLMVTEHALLFGRQRVVQFIGARSFDYADFMVDRSRPDALAALLDRLLDHEDGFSLLSLRDIPGTSPTINELRRHAASRHRHADIRVLYEAPTRLLNDPPADRKLLNKKSLKRHYNHFRKSGRLEFRHSAGVEEALAWLEILFRQHVGRRARTDSPSLFLDERMRAFYRELVLALEPQGWLLFSVVLFNGEPIATHLGFRYGERIIWYKPAFDMDCAKHSPGEVLIRCLLEYAMDSKAGEFDFTVGEEAFKYRFANHVRVNYAVRVYGSPTSYRLNRLLLDAKAAVKRFPALARVMFPLFRRWREQPWI